MAKYIDRASIMRKIENESRERGEEYDTEQILMDIEYFQDADVVEEENILKFYYVRSIDEYWIGRRIDNFYYAEYDPESRQWTWTHSRYLPWGEHIVSQTSLWKEHTYPSEPEEIPFADWLQGFIKKHADVVEWKTCRNFATEYDDCDQFVCSQCGIELQDWRRVERDEDGLEVYHEYRLRFCPNCGAKMIGGDDDA